VQVDAVFNSFQEASPDPDKYQISGLRVVWFQNEWALPIADEVVAHLEALLWIDHAKDVEL
jgi:hypothetical protein